MKQVGLFFGSFNPIHNGHLMLAQYMLNFAHIDEIWFVVSPQNPFKQNSQLLDAKHRVKMVDLATANAKNMFSCDIELTLPTPSYTVNTLSALRSRYTDCEFSIIMGGDNLEGLPHWREPEKIIANHRIIVYPRRGCQVPTIESARIDIVEAPQFDISSTMLRGWLVDGLSINSFTPREVVDYISENKLYEK